MKFAGILLTFLSMATVALAIPVEAPEIDGSSLTSGLTLIAGVLMVARSRRKK